MELLVAGLIMASFFQLIGALVLASARAAVPRVHWLASLLGLNAAVSFLSALEGTGATAARSWVAAVDALTLPLLVGAHPALAGRTRVLLLGAAAALALVDAAAHALWPAVARAFSFDVVVRAVPYYLALAALIAHSALRAGAAGWVALAFLPRALYFGLTGLAPRATAWEWADGAGKLVLLAASLWALARLLRRGTGPPRVVVAAVGMMGPLFWLAVQLQGAWNLTTVFFDLATLAIARPLLLYVGLCPGDLPRIVRRTAEGGLAAVLVLAASSLWTDARAPAAVAFSGGIGLAVIAALEAVSPRAAASGAEGIGAPLWQRALPELLGSERPEAAPRAEWTQQELARRLRVSPRRISELARLNERCEGKLDRWVPEWRAAGASRPVVIEAHQGAVAGKPGVWRYYRLTPLGARLAQAVSRDRSDDFDDLAVRSEAEPAS
ncbi:MAG TPA: hypothetical protein VFH78_07740 [Candidatus Thermoplasmatota archaeon]|nr:hypothetical protein [Candidatus Thermoplasmatota archaeon]